MSNPLSELIPVATLGKTVGLKGDMKLHIESDFPEQFRNGAEFLSKERSAIVLENVNDERGTVRLKGVTTPEAAQRFVNQKLYTTYDATRQNIQLEDGEYFWFDIVGCSVYEGSMLLGSVEEIERIGAVDYLQIKTDVGLVLQGENKKFLIPYQPPFVVSTDIEKRRIDVQGGLDLLQAS